MKRLLLIPLALLFFSCDEDNPASAMQESVFGCTDSTACNYNSDADTDDGTCGYQGFSCYSSDCVSDLTILNTNLLIGGSFNPSNIISQKKYVLSGGTWYEFDIEPDFMSSLHHHILDEGCVDELLSNPIIEEYLYDNCVISIFTNEFGSHIAPFYWYVEDNIFIALNSIAHIPQGIYQIQLQPYLEEDNFILRRDVSETEYIELKFTSQIES